MRGWLVLIMAGIFLFGFAAEQGEQREEWEDISAETEEIVSLVQAENYEEGRTLLNELADDLTGADYEAMGLDVHDMGTIIMSYERLQGALTDVSLADAERLNAAYRFHYVIDAVVHPEEPKWKETENEVKEQVQHLRTSASAGGQTFEQAWNDWKRTFETIHPAATLRMSPSEREELRSLMTFMEEHRQRLKDEEDARPFFNALEYQIDRLYNEDIEADDPSLLIVIFTVGGTIVLALSYAGWKKYRGEQRRERRRRDR
ncbi:sporulation protein YpjB [Natribacillus halophilus]|uniref:Sporulation protein YpjB n=1 Tax=Natribacillus halophilus TaxID=549003 RepID=A0A1G8JCM3_9BACI|nr:sporulation protein YpjB [Natribacillus halophilus]SDI28380.1 sporulation protein YpjB [Natribacillus halophilus]